MLCQSKNRSHRYFSLPSPPLHRLSAFFPSRRDEFSDHPNYYKLLADFSLYDSEGHYAPHKSVAFDMPDTVPYLDQNGNKKYMKTEDYIKQELKGELAVRDSLAVSLADQSEDGIIPTFKRKVKENLNAPSTTPSDSAVMSGRKQLDNGDEIGYNDGNSNTNGGNYEGFDRGTEASVSEGKSGTRETDADRPRVQSERGEEASRLPETRETSDGMLHNGRGRDLKHPKYYTESDFFHPKKGTALHTLQSKALEEYALKCHIVKESSWSMDSGAFIYKGEIYVVETIDDGTLKDVIPHEGTHAMLQVKFKPYLDFLESTPDMIDFHSKGFSRLVKDLEEHLRKKKADFDFMNMNEKERDAFYDELNAYVYGLTKGGALEDSNYDYGEWIPDAFQDFDAYINELTSIHEQFRTERKGNDTLYSLRNTPEISDRELLADALESVAENEIDRKKLRQYKAKVAQADELDRTLAELQAKKKALTEAKAKRNEIIKVQDEITKTQNRITIIDKGLLDLESTVSLKMTCRTVN